MRKPYLIHKSLIKPIIILFDILILNAVVFIYSNNEYFNYTFILYLNISWLIISIYTSFYSIYRYTHSTKLISLVFSQFFVFILAFFAFFTIFREGILVSKQFLFILTITLSISAFKIFSFFYLKRRRTKGINFKSVIVFGGSKVAQNTASLFVDRQDLGYRFHGFFSDKFKKLPNYLGSFEQGLLFAIENTIDEIYCEAGAITTSQHKELRVFCNSNEIDFRLIPENKAIYSKDFTLEYYGTIPILKPKKLPFERIDTHLIKRSFDIVFSFCVCLFLLIFVFPLLWIFVKLDSKGPLFFKQKRDGIDGKQFYCYKIRSMTANVGSDIVSATKNDNRITKVGKFLRKTSIDELPQFFNVLLGDMSIVGPRPHMNIQTEKYVKDIDNYLIRNSVKPGITGLAQVSGYRGEVQQKSDIQNRVRLDIFYIENWSFFLDIKIIVQTVLNVFYGEKKAY